MGIPLPLRSKPGLSVAYIDDEANFELLGGKISENGEKITFTTTHFSKYCLIWSTATEPQVNRPEGNTDNKKMDGGMIASLVVLIVAVLAVIGSVVLAVLLYLKLKKVTLLNGAYSQQYYYGYPPDNYGTFITKETLVERLKDVLKHREKQIEDNGGIIPERVTEYNSYHYEGITMVTLESDPLDKLRLVLLERMRRLIVEQYIAEANVTFTEDIEQGAETADIAETGETEEAHSGTENVGEKTLEEVTALVDETVDTEETSTMETTVEESATEEKKAEEVKKSEETVATNLTENENTEKKEKIEEEIKIEEKSAREKEEKYETEKAAPDTKETVKPPKSVYVKPPIKIAQIAKRQSPKKKK